MKIGLFDVLGQNEELAVQFWEQDYPIGERRSLLDTMQRCFPLEFKPFLELIDSLIGGSRSALYMIKYFQNLSTFTDVFTESRYMLPGLSRNSQTRVFFKEGGLVYGSKNLQLFPKPKSVGHFVAREVVLLEYSYSGFHLLLCIIDSFLSMDVFDNRSLEENILIGSIENTTLAFQIFSSVFENLDSYYMKQFMAHLGQLHNVPKNVAEFFLNLISSVLQRCSNLATPCFDLVTNCLKCLSRLLKFYPDNVWRHLRAQNFLPKYIASAAPGSYSASSYLQHVVLPAERAMGRYKITLMFLQLVTDLVVDAQILKKTSR
jgi:hypothetical protein